MKAYNIISVSHDRLLQQLRLAYHRLKCCLRNDEKIIPVRSGEEGSVNHLKNDENAVFDVKNAFQKGMTTVWNAEWPLAHVRTGVLNTEWPLKHVLTGVLLTEWPLKLVSKNDLFAKDPLKHVSTNIGNTEQSLKHVGTDVLEAELIPHQDAMDGLISINHLIQKRKNVFR